jgi:hypothetical protein
MFSFPSAPRTTLAEPDTFTSPKSIPPMPARASDQRPRLISTLTLATCLPCASVSVTGPTF